MMKIHSCLLGHFLIPVLVGVASLSFIRCAWLPDFEASKDQTIDPAKKDKSNKPLLTEITNEVIRTAKGKIDHFG